jgi:hypothetical protein
MAKKTRAAKKGGKDFMKFPSADVDENPSITRFKGTS